MSSHCSVGGIGVCSQTAVAAAVFSLWTLPNIRSDRTWCAVCSSSSVSRSLTGAHCRYWGSLQLCVHNVPLCLTMKKANSTIHFKETLWDLDIDAGAEYKTRRWLSVHYSSECRKFSVLCQISILRKGFSSHSLIRRQQQPQSIQATAEQLLHLRVSQSFLV